MARPLMLHMGGKDRFPDAVVGDRLVAAHDSNARRSCATGHAFTRDGGPHGVEMTARKADAGTQAFAGHLRA